jgi:hypothetical protein
VREKKPDDELPKSHRIPRRIRIAKRNVVTDVLQIGPLRKQSNTFPNNSALLTYDGVETGTLSCLCRSPFGVFGLTCAHVLGGPDHDASTTTPVAIWSSEERRYESVGQSVLAIAGPGAGSPGEFGFADAAIFSIMHPELIQRAQSAHLIVSREPIVGSTVLGNGVVQGRRAGQIIGIDQMIGNIRADLAIRVDLPGTFRGDSGMLWKDGDGNAVAIHAYGEDLGPGQGSRLTAAMLAHRAETRLAIQFLDQPL